MPHRRYFWSTWLGVAALAACAALIGYYRTRDAALHAAAQSSDAMSWLRLEFALTDAQMAAIDTLHRSYAVECEQHCLAIAEARQQLAEMERRGAPPSELEAQRVRVRERVDYCEGAIGRHLRRVAALMPPEQGRRYLDLLLPRVAQFEHRGAPDLRLNP